MTTHLPRRTVIRLGAGLGGLGFSLLGLGHPHVTPQCRIVRDWSKLAHEHRQAELLIIKVDCRVAIR